MNVLENYDIILCSICCTNSSSDYFDIHENAIGFKNEFFTLAHIIGNLLSGINVSSNINY